MTNEADMSEGMRKAVLRSARDPATGGIDAVLADALRAYERVPSPEYRRRLISILSQTSFRHAQDGASVALADDLDALLSFGARDEAQALFGFLKDQCRDDPAVAVTVRHTLVRHGERALAQEWGEVPRRMLLVLPPRQLAAKTLARFVSSVRQNLGAGDLFLARRGDALLPESLAGNEVATFNAELVRGFTELVFIDGSGEYADADGLAASGADVYRFDQADPGFEIRLVPVGRGRRPSDYPHLANHVFNRVTSALHNHYYFFPYGYLYRYLGVGPVNAFGHRIDTDLAGYRQRAPTHKLIACFGGSSCFSMYCLHDEMFPSRIEAKLNAWAKETGSPLEFTVLNFGQHGNVVLNQILTYLLFVQELRPDIVISHDGFNDLGYGQVADSTLLGRHHIVYQDNLEEWANILNKAEAAPPSDGVVDGVRQVQSMPDAVVTAYLARERQFAALATNAGSRFVWGLQPFLLGKRRHSPAESQFERQAMEGQLNRRYLDCYRNMSFLYESVAVRASEVAGADFVNLHREFRDLDGRETHFFDIVHLSPLGDEVVADTYVDRLIALFEKEAT